MVKIKLKCSMAGAQVIAAGSIIETTMKEATSLVSAGYAEFVEEDDVELATSKEAHVRSKTVKRRKK